MCVKLVKVETFGHTLVGNIPRQVPSVANSHQVLIVGDKYRI